MKTVRLGILGCANIVEKYIVSAIKEVKTCHLVAIASRDPEKAKDWAKRFSCGYENSYEDLLRREDIDAVYLPLPVGLHQEWVIRAANAGKHVLCEKSLAESFDSVKKMVLACRNRGLHLYENFMCHYHPQHEKVISLINNNEIGKPFLFRGSFAFPPLPESNIRYSKELGGGSLNDAGAYPLFMVRKIFANEPEAVTCRLQYQKQMVDIQGNALLEFPHERSAFISFGFNNFYQNNYSVWGEKGLITVNRAYSIPPEMKPEVELQQQGFSQKVEVNAENHFTLIFSDFCDALLQNKKLEYGPLLAQARVMEALRRSAEQNRKVGLSEIE